MYPHAVGATLGKQISVTVSEQDKTLVEKSAMHDQEGGSCVGGKSKRVTSPNEVILDSKGTTLVSGKRRTHLGLMEGRTGLLDRLGRLLGKTSSPQLP